jgi:hypothetical protein
MQYRPLTRVTCVAVLAFLVSAPTPSRLPLPASRFPRITVFKDPNCGCCRNWVEHLRKHGFDVVSRDTSDLSGVKRTARVPQQLLSCHTAFVGGYVIEGHVPAVDIERLLREKPKVAGVAVPGMPAGSPGMEVGGRVDRYDVVAFGRDGSAQVYARH